MSFGDYEDYMANKKRLLEQSKHMLIESKNIHININDWYNKQVQTQ